MASPIARRPSGLLDLLLTQQQGKNPADLLDTLQPVLDIGQFYEQDRLAVEQGTSNATAVDATTTVTIPSGESWKVHGVAVRWTWATVNQELGIRFEIKNLGNLQDLVTSVTKTAGSISDTDAVAFMFPNPIILPSGTILRSRVSRIVLDGEANIQLTFNVLHVRMES